MRSRPLLSSPPFLWVLALCTTSILCTAGGAAGLDFTVYRDAGMAVLRNRDFYAAGQGPMGGPGLPFTYPPFAAIIFAPLACAPPVVGYWVLAAMSTILQVAVVLHLDSISDGLGRRSWLRSVTPLLVILSAPFVATVSYGQVNLLLFGSIYLAATLRRGFGWVLWVVVGVAAGIKLTPLALLLAPLALLDLRAVLIGLTTFVGTQAIGFMALPTQTVRYWGDVVWDPSRVGDVSYIDNLSLRGLVERLGAPTPLWVALVLIVVCMGVAAIRVHRARKDIFFSLGVAATVMLLISPISWVHHFVWWPLMAYAWVAPDVHRDRGGRFNLTSVTRLFVAVQIVSAKAIMGLVGFDIQGDPPWWAVLYGAMTPLLSCAALLLLVLRKRDES